jgi:kynureninase
MDAADPLARFRSEFEIPKQAPHGADDAESIYLCGNSLGCMPKRARALVNEEMDKWALQGVEGHFNGARPWAKVDEFVTPLMADVVGAKSSDEVVVMNTLSVNVHLFMVSFYKPTDARHKIIMEAGAFCSDQHIVRSQLALHGRSLDDSLITLAPRDGETHLRTEDIVARIAAEGDSVALVLFGGLQFYTGQFFDFKAITDAGHATGAFVGFDCAHAVGNCVLKLHEWGVDFACWCSYKYLNAHPGGIAGAFLHERHHNKTLIELPRLAGWWGQPCEDRFAMRGEWRPFAGAQSYQVGSLVSVNYLPCICYQMLTFIYSFVPHLRYILTR